MYFSKSKIRLVITSGYRWDYFEWFLLGFKLLEKKDLISIKYKLPINSRLLMYVNSPYISKIIRRFISHFEKDSYNMEGYFLFPDGRKRKFCIDSADSPYLFDEQSLKQNNIYFKMQCPKNIETPDFKLTDKIHIPWSDHAHTNSSLKLTDRGERKKILSLARYKDKIKPLMIGPRQLALGCGYKALDSAYKNYLKDQKYYKTDKIMCYFGNAHGPGYEEKIDKLDVDWEKDIMGYYKNKISHPNEKRQKVANYISELPKSDARVISHGCSDSKARRNKNLIIPLKDFCKHISQFQYNMNVSGYRLSIPNRFIESFIVGTAICTDKLNVKWYKPFEDEVIENVKMGYLPMNQVSWDKFEKDLDTLPESNPGKVISNFKNKWAPEVVAKYIITTVKKS